MVEMVVLPFVAKNRFHMVVQMVAMEEKVEM
jgi:hypothetical protein